MRELQALDDWYTIRVHGLDIESPNPEGCVVLDDPERVRAGLRCLLELDGAD